MYVCIYVCWILSVCVLARQMFNSAFNVAFQTRKALLYMLNWPQICSRQTRLKVYSASNGDPELEPHCWIKFSIILRIAPTQRGGMRWVCKGYSQRFLRSVDWVNWERRQNEYVCFVSEKLKSKKKRNIKANKYECELNENWKKKKMTRRRRRRRRGRRRKKEKRKRRM